MLGGILAGIGGLASGLLGADAAGDAASAQKKIAKKQLKLQGRMYDETVARYQPYLRAGNNALSAYNYELGLGSAPRGYSGIDLSPGAQFAMQQGRDTIEGGAAGSGGLYSGNTLKALETMRQGYAAQDRDTQLNRLAGLISIGTNAAGGASTAAQGYASGAGTALANMGDAAASGSIGKANALTGGLTNAIQLYQLGQMGNLGGAAGTAGTAASTGGLGGWLGSLW